MSIACRLFPVLFVLSLLVRAEDAPSFRFAAIADAHVSSPEGLARLRAFFHTVKKKHAPDFLVMLGDNCGHAPEYLPMLHEVILHAGLAVHLVPGNHDDNYAKNPEWHQSVFGRMFYSFKHKGWRFVMNWSQAQPLEWLRKDLAALDKQTPLVFCQHYAPKRPPLPEEEVVKEEPWASVLAHPGPKLLLTGHWHRHFEQTLAGAPSVTLDQWYVQSERDPGEYALFACRPDGTFEAQYLPMNGLELEEPADKVPQVRVAEGADGAVLSGPLVVSGTASDDEAVKRVSFQVDDGAWRPAEGAAEWTFRLDPRELAPGHHQVRVRSFDAQGQGAIFFQTFLVFVPSPPRKGVVELQQGLNGYAGCADATVRIEEVPKKPDGTEGEADDLESWLGWRMNRQGEKKLVEHSEIYLRFDLTGCGLRPDARIAKVTLVLQGSRQNAIDPEGKRCRYALGVLKMPWKPELTYAERPAQPGWKAEENPQPPPDLSGSWPALGGAQIVWPPKPVEIDLTALKETIRQWLADPNTNFGLVVSPAFGKDHNMSFKSSRCKYPTLRPKLVIELEGTP